MCWLNIVAFFEGWLYASFRHSRIPFLGEPVLTAGCIKFFAGTPTLGFLNLMQVLRSHMVRMLE